MMKRGLILALAVLALPTVTSAQVGPPCCQEEEVTIGGAPVATNALVGNVDQAGRRFTVSTDQGDRIVNLYVTAMQEGHQPRRVNLSRYRGRNIAVMCQLWHGSEDAWGCEAIGRLRPTAALPPER